jgi:hypothetical protein
MNGWSHTDGVMHSGAIDILIRLNNNSVQNSRGDSYLAPTISRRLRPRVMIALRPSLVAVSLPHDIKWWGLKDTPTTAALISESSLLNREV